MSDDSQPRRYFDNAATSFPKPPGVVEAVCDYMVNVGASAGRGAYREAVESRRMLDECRDAIRTLFNATPDDDVVFTLNGTDALNTAIKGIVKPGDHVVTTAMDHNSVLRPLTTLRERGVIDYSVVPVDPDTTLLTPDELVAALRDNTTLVALNHASNVTGALQPVEQIAELCHARGVKLLVDAAQSAGHVATDFSTTPIDLLACPGHKGLLGPLGTGVLLIRAGVGQLMATSREGGTGSHSELVAQPEMLPDRFEAGSHNAAGIAGLLVGVRWLLARGIDDVRAQEMELIQRVLDGLSACPGLRCLGPRAPQDHVGVFSVTLEGFEPVELSALLEQEFGLLTRSGLHCAPLAHQALGTYETGGTTRLSTGVFTTSEDVDTVIDALYEIARHAERVLDD